MRIPRGTDVITCSPLPFLSDDSLCGSISENVSNEDVGVQAEQYTVPALQSKELPKEEEEEPSPYQLTTADGRYSPVNSE